MNLCIHFSYKWLENRTPGGHQRFKFQSNLIFSLDPARKKCIIFTIACINIIRERDSMWANINAIVARCVFISYIIYAFASFLKLCLRRCIFMYNSVSWHYITWYKIRYFSWIKTKETNSLPNIYLQANLHNTFYICTIVYLNQSINPW